MSSDSTPELGAFSGILAEVRHDLRTPAGHLIGYSEMMVEDLEDEDRNCGVEDLKAIHSEGQKLVELIDELLGVSKTHLSDLDLPQIQKELSQPLVEVESHCGRVKEQFEAESEEDLLPDLEKIITARGAFQNLIDQRLTAEHFSQVTVPHVEIEAQPTHSIAHGDAAPALTTSELAEGGEILVVDDDASNRDLLCRRLTKQGYSPIAVDSGEEALVFLVDQSVDLVLLDLMMPGLSGAEVLTLMKSDPGLKNIPVIMLSALDDVSQVVQCILMGAEDYLFKPFNAVLLKARIGASLEKYRLRKQSALKLRVFISSPGDVSPERQMVKNVISRLNDELSGQVFMVPVLWEDEPLLASETAQTQIVLPRVTDIFVAILWARMGTRLPDDIRRPDGSIYDSGTEFEFEDALTEAKKTGRPDMLMYRKMCEPIVSLTNRQDILDRLDQKERLEVFIKRWFTSPDGESISGVFHAFQTVEELEGLVENHLRKLANQHLAAVDTDTPVESES